jgi:hypothetical protein
VTKKCKRETVENKYIWPAGSISLIYAFFNIIFFIFLTLKFDFISYSVLVITNIFLTVVLCFLELSGCGKSIWKLWVSIPSIFHKLICLVCLGWISYIVPKALMPAIKEDYYEGNQS